MSVNPSLKNEIVKAPLIRRFGAFLTDVFILLLLFLSLNSYVVSPLLAKSYQYESLVDLYLNRQLDSNLYVTYNNKIVEFIDTYDSTLENQYKFYEKVDEKLNAFYTEFSNEGIKLNDFNSSKETSNLFELVEGEYVLKNNVTVIQLSEFYSKEYDKAISLFNHYDDEYLDLARKITLFDIYSILISSSVALILLYLIIPLCMKNGETLGKLLLSIGVVSAKDGFRVKKSQTVVRFLILFIFEFALSLFLVAIPLIVSFSFLVFSKKSNAIHDYFAATICVDKKQCLIYKNYEEFLEHELVVLK